MLDLENEEQNLVKLRTETESNEFTLWSLKYQREQLCSAIDFLQNMLKRLDVKISDTMEAMKYDNR